MIIYEQTELAILLSYTENNYYLKVFELHENIFSLVKDAHIYT